MLAVKSTCKDRWRQIRAGAELIKHKHLATLEPGISSNQTDEMKANSVTLVLPRALHDSYSENQQLDVLDLRGFLSLVLLRQLN